MRGTIAITACPHCRFVESLHAVEMATLNNRIAALEFALLASRVKMGAMSPRNADANRIDEIERQKDREWDRQREWERKQTVPQEKAGNL